MNTIKALVFAIATFAIGTSPVFSSTGQAIGSPLSKSETATRDPAGNTPLHFAALRLDVGAVRALLAAHATANVRNSAGATPLLYGAGNSEIVELLIASGADPNAKSSAGNTPLLSAVMHNPSLAPTRLLIDAGADVNACVPFPGTERNMSVLERAIMGGDSATIKLLLDRGADPRAAGTAPVSRAADVGDLATVEMLLNLGADPNRFAGHGGPALNAALFNRHTDVASVLIERGGDLNLRTAEGHQTPPIVWSAYNETGDATVAKALMSRGANVNTTDDIGETALSYALKAGSDTPLVAFLRSVGATEPLQKKIKSVPNRTIPESPAERQMFLRENVQRAVDLLQRSSTSYLNSPRVRTVAKCISCHHQNLPAITYDLARSRGLRVDPHQLGQQLSAHLRRWWGERPLANALEVGIPFGDGNVQASYGLIALRALHYQTDDVTDAYVHFLLRRQNPDGSWTAFDTRPPIEDGPITATALAVRAIMSYPMSGRERDVVSATLRAQRWLAQQRGPSHNEAVMQLLGLAWSGQAPSELALKVASVAKAQSLDGGWAQLPGLDSDAYATGTTLYALHEAGLPTTDSVYQRGAAFLLRTQFEDGSWWVRTRTWPFQPYFDSQFPHGRDQWISAGATAWAAAALLLTLEAKTSAEFIPTGQELIADFVASSGENTKSAAISTTGLLPGKSDSAFDLQPIFDRSCSGCHSGKNPKAGLDISSRSSLIKGGESGLPAIVPGKSDDSLLIRYVSGAIEDLEMPPLARRKKFPALSQDEIYQLRTWIDAGAPLIPQQTRQK